MKTEITGRDRNFRSWDGGGDDPPDTDVVLDPVADGWKPGSWADTAKFHARVGMHFARIEVLVGGCEDGVDVNNGCNDNRFDQFTVAAGDRNVLTLKGGSSRNLLSNWVVTKHGPVVDVEIGNWSDYNVSRCRGNRFYDWAAEDGQPITYCYRWGCRPAWVNTKTRHLWWRSAGLTAYWWAKYVWVKVLRLPAVW